MSRRRLGLFSRRRAAGTRHHRLGRRKRQVGLVLGAIAGLVLLCGSLGAVSLMWAERPVRQPISYNHQVHVKKHQIQCVQCHVGAESAARATIPNIEHCGQICHRPDMPALTMSRGEEALRRYLVAGQKIPWAKVYHVDRHVYFSHARHTVVAQLSCETCHGNVGDMTTPIQEQAVRISMNHCMQCHEQHRVNNDCNTCHR